MYTIKKVSNLVGIPTVTIRAWENRYNIISPQRSDGGHRLYSQDDINTLKWLKEQMDNSGLKISEAVRLLSEKPINNYIENQFKQDKKRIDSFDELQYELYQRLIDLQTVQANEIIDLAFSLHAFEDVFLKVLTPVLVRIGDEWEAGTIGVAQEHFASELIMQRFTNFFRVLPSLEQLPKVIAFCPEGEFHHIGLMLFSLFLRKKGHEVIYLGANTPYIGLMEIIKTKNISVIAISTTDSCHIEKIMKWIRGCLQENPDLMFVLGGKGFENTQIRTASNVFISGEKGWEDLYESYSSLHIT
ncbi:MerR family transcriptional regulator [Bacillus sp. CGMCC 1.16607]|uniref:MerR family transcriptional regulator n=1 Tax=Bacillus sp. CGMCC 1.16607 TaxID=3351842 RepID=UPI00363F4054